MKQIIPVFVLVIGLCMMLMTSLSLMSYQMQMINARDFHAMCVDSLQASNYSQKTMDELQKSAEDKKWTLTVGPAQGNGSSYRLYRITLNYKVSVPLFGTEKDDLVITGFGK